MGVIRCITGNSLKVDCDIVGHAKKCKLHVDIAGSLNNYRHSSHR